MFLNFNPFSEYVFGLAVSKNNKYMICSARNSIKFFCLETYEELEHLHITVDGKNLSYKNYIYLIRCSQFP